MKKTNILMAIVSLFLLVTTSCSTLNQSVREPNTRLNLTKSDFSLSEQVSGEATTTKILSIDWSRLFKKEMGTVDGPASGISAASIPIIGGFISDKTSSYALYNMMKNNKGYDVVLYPQFETKVNRPILGLGFLFSKTYVKATARLGTLNK